MERDPKYLCGKLMYEFGSWLLVSAWQISQSRLLCYTRGTVYLCVSSLFSWRYFGTAEGSKFVEAGSVDNVKRTWVDYGISRDWKDPEQGQVYTWHCIIIQTMGSTVRTCEFGDHYQFHGSQFPLSCYHVGWGISVSGNWSEEYMDANGRNICQLIGGCLWTQKIFFSLSITLIFCFGCSWWDYDSSLLIFIYIAVSSYSLFWT